MSFRRPKRRLPSRLRAPKPPCLQSFDASGRRERSPSPTVKPRVPRRVSVGIPVRTTSSSQCPDLRKKRRATKQLTPLEPRPLVPDRVNTTDRRTRKDTGLLRNPHSPPAAKATGYSSQTDIVPFQIPKAFQELHPSWYSPEFFPSAPARPSEALNETYQALPYPGTVSTEVTFSNTPGFGFVGNPGVFQNSESQASNQRNQGDWHQQINTILPPTFTQPRNMTSGAQVVPRISEILGYFKLEGHSSFRVTLPSTTGCTVALQAEVNIAYEYTFITKAEAHRRRLKVHKMPLKKKRLYPTPNNAMELPSGIIITHLESYDHHLGPIAEFNILVLESMVSGVPLHIGWRYLERAYRLAPTWEMAYIGTSSRADSDRTTGAVVTHQENSFLDASSFVSVPNLPGTSVPFSSSFASGMDIDPTLLSSYPIDTSSYPIDTSSSSSDPVFPRTPISAAHYSTTPASSMTSGASLLGMNWEGLQDGVTPTPYPHSGASSCDMAPTELYAVTPRRTNAQSAPQLHTAIFPTQPMAGVQSSFEGTQPYFLSSGGLDIPHQQQASWPGQYTSTNGSDGASDQQRSYRNPAEGYM